MNPRPIPLAVLIALSAGGLRADINAETGAYVFRNYLAKEYGASPENWGIAEDRRGVIYVANSSGLLEFDGVSWHIKPLAGKSVVRSVDVDGNGAVYVGGNGDFGYLEPDASGTSHLISLVDRIPQQDRQFGNVWRVLPVAAGVYFSSNSRLFRLNRDGTIKVWKPETSFGRALALNGEIYVKTPERGLLTIRGDELTSVPGGDSFARVPVEDATPIEGGALIATGERLFRMTISGVDDFHTTADHYFKAHTIYSVRMLPGGELAVGTRTGGLVLLNSKGVLDRIITKSEGLADNFVSAIYTDRQGGVWVPCYGGGISRFNPGLSRFDERSGIQDVLVSLRQANVLYAGSKGGLYRIAAKPGDAPAFAHIDEISGAVWSLVRYQGDLLAAADRGVYRVANDKAEQILETPQKIFDVSVSRRDPNTLYAAGTNFVYVLHREGAGWKSTPLRIPGQEFRTILEDNDGGVWATASGAIWRFDFRTQPVQQSRFGPVDGVPAGGLINAQRFQGRVIFATGKGLRRWSAETRRFVPDAVLGNEFADGRDVLNIFPDRLGNVWVTGNNYHGILLRQTSGYKWLAMPLLQSGIDEIWWMSLDDDGTAWATGADGVLFRWQRDLAGNPDRNFSVLTRGVEAVASMKSLYGGAGNPGDFSVPYRSNALRFDFAAPFYEQPAAIEYRVRLDGHDGDWSMWSHESHKDYTDLWENSSYTFHVQARSPHGTVSDDSTFQFAVLPPWFRTWWAYALYAICGAFGVWGVVGLRVRQLEADKRQLEATVEERTVEIRHQRDEIHAQERKSHALLLNILPSQVADELKSTGAVKPVGFDDVTVCFTDFVGFTLSSEKLPPDLLVDALNDYFTAFDEITARYGLEKLKTIGDSYMFVSGLPARRASHAVDAVLAALEMSEVVKRLAVKAGGTGWNIRIGLHSGPVVAGVVGIRKFAFDIWGNTVNFAARMESSGVPGRVNMSERTCRLTRNLIDCEFRGQVKIKEGRELPMFLARGLGHDFEARYTAEFGEAPRSVPETVAESHRSLNALVR